MAGKLGTQITRVSDHRTRLAWQHAEAKSNLVVPCEYLRSLKAAPNGRYPGGGGGGAARGDALAVLE